MALIDLPNFLTSSDKPLIELPVFLKNQNQNTKAACTRTCQVTCQANSQCGVCQYCQTDCQTSCQTQYQKCGGCETSAQCGTCQHGCETTCEKNCQGCEIYSQCGNKESSCNYSESPAMCSYAACQNQAEACSWIKMDPCDNACQTSCEKGCQTSCEKNCQSSCERYCESSCEDSCQTSCERYCQSSCELNYQCGICQAACQNACQVACQDCQTACQLNYQHVHAFKTYYEAIDATYHNKFERCDEDNYIKNQISESHIYTKEYYLDGHVYQTCMVCGYLKYVRVAEDFEWDIFKGDDTSDICITHTEWNRYLDLLSLKLSSANRDSNVNAIKVSQGEIITASKFNLIIDKLLLLGAKNVPNKVNNQTLILPTSHLNAIKNNLNALRKL